MKKSIEEIAKETGRYSPAAFKFVYEGLGYTVQNIAKEPRHISGQTLCEGLRRMAMRGMAASPCWFWAPGASR